MLGRYVGPESDGYVVGWLMAGVLLLALMLVLSLVLGLDPRVGLRPRVLCRCGLVAEGFVGFWW